MVRKACSDIIGIAEFASILGRGVNATNRSTYRRDFPVPANRTATTVAKEKLKAECRAAFGAVEERKGGAGQTSGNGSLVDKLRRRIRPEPFIFFYCDGAEYGHRVRSWRAALRVMVLQLAFVKIHPSWKRWFRDDCALIAAERNRLTPEEWAAIVSQARDHYALENAELRKIYRESRRREPTG